MAVQLTSLAHVYQVEAVSRVLDGDTYVLRLDVGFRFAATVKIRLDGWDCPEARRGSAYERARAADARDLAREFLASHAGLWVATQPDPDDFGRWLGRIWDETSGVVADLGQALAAARLATPWPTRWRSVYDAKPP